MDRYTGTILKDRFVLEDVIGSGGMAVVYRATDRVTGNTVAVKILKEEFVTDEQFRRRFLNESRAISMLRHRNIVSVIDFDFEGNLQYIVMEYVDGITLKDFMRSQKIIPSGIAIKIIMQTLSALQHAHERGVIHRDIKPQNIMILTDGTIKVMDFGIARIDKFETVTMTDKAIGTVYYISPEQARGEHTDERSDIYSVGVMLYEMLTGEMPFDGDTPVSVALKQIQAEAPRPRSINRSIPEGLEQIVMRAMMKTPAKRYASALDMIHDLNAVLHDPTATFDYDLTEELPTGDLPVKGGEEKAEKGKFWTKGNVLALLAGIGAAILIIVLVAVLLGGNGSQSGSQVTVPKFVGMTWEEVQKNTEYNANFKIKTTEEFNADVPAGEIFEQSVQDGTSVGMETVIELKVSKGAKTQTIPDLSNTTVADAEELLKKQNITYEIIRQKNDTIQKDYVIKTAPAAGKELAEGDTLFLYVSSGTNAVMVKVPLVTGKLQSEAEYLLSEKNLIAVVIEQASDTVKKGYVISQMNDAGTELAEGSKVIIVVSSGSSSTNPDNPNNPTNPDQPGDGHEND